MKNPIVSISQSVSSVSVTIVGSNKQQAELKANQIIQQLLLSGSLYPLIQQSKIKDKYKIKIFAKNP